MTQRERLKILIGDMPVAQTTNELTEYLLSHGVMVSRCKVGDKVYDRLACFTIERIEYDGEKILYRCGNKGTDDYMAFYEDELGTRVFLSSEGKEETSCSAN